MCSVQGPPFHSLSGSPSCAPPRTFSTSSLAAVAFTLPSSTAPSRISSASASASASASSSRPAAGTAGCDGDMASTSTTSRLARGRVTTSSPSSASGATLRAEQLLLLSARTCSVVALQPPFASAPNASCSAGCLCRDKNARSFDRAFPSTPLAPAVSVASTGAPSPPRWRFASEVLSTACPGDVAATGAQRAHGCTAL